MPFEDPPSDLAYLKLFIVVLLAVTGGNLLSTWITARVVEYRLEAAAAEASERLKQELARGRQAAEDAQAQSQLQAAALSERVQLARRGDKTGIKLGQACTEWTKAHEGLRSYTTQAEKDKACARLITYVQTGVAPRE